MVGSSSGTEKALSSDLLLLGVDGADESKRIFYCENRHFPHQMICKPSIEPTLISSSSSSSNPWSIGGGVLHIRGGIDLSILDESENNLTK